jgi:hypothetical protein
LVVALPHQAEIVLLSLPHALDIHCRLRSMGVSFTAIAKQLEQLGQPGRTGRACGKRYRKIKLTGDWLACVMTLCDWELLKVTP